MIHVQCPDCGEKLAVQPGVVGTWVSCETCQQAFEAKASDEPEVIAANLLLAQALEEPADQFAEALVAQRVASEAGTADAAPGKQVRRTDKRGQEPARGMNLWLAMGIPVVCLLVGVAALVVILLKPGRRQEAPPLAPPPNVAARKEVAIEANTLLYDPFRAHLYVAVRATAVKDASCIVAIDPATGAAVWSVNVGSDPHVLALSDNGAVLWVAFKGVHAIQRLDLETRMPGPLFDVGRRSLDPLFVEQMVVLPGTDDSVVVSLFDPKLRPGHEGVAIFDNGIKRPRSTQVRTGANLLVLTDERDTLIGYNSKTTEFGLRRLDILPKGVMEGEVVRGVVAGDNLELTFADGRLWCSDGTMLDASTLKRVGKIPTKGSVAVDVPGNRVYFLDRDRRVLEAFDLKRTALMRSQPMELDKTASQLTNLAGTALAYRTDRQVIILPTRDLR